MPMSKVILFETDSIQQIHQTSKASQGIGDFWKYEDLCVCFDRFAVLPRDNFDANKKECF